MDVDPFGERRDERRVAQDGHISNAVLRTEDIQRLAWRVYPYVASELFLRWREEELSKVVEGVLAALAENGVLQPNEDHTAWMRPPPDSPQAMQLSLLAQATIQTIERYYLAISTLLNAGSGVITQKALEQDCQAAAQRINPVQKPLEMAHCAGRQIVQDHQAPGLALALLNCALDPAVRIIPVARKRIPEHAGKFARFQEIHDVLAEQPAT